MSTVIDKFQPELLGRPFAYPAFQKSAATNAKPRHNESTLQRSNREITVSQWLGRLSPIRAGFSAPAQVITYPSS
ncbi:uncharacterized protein UV8b_02090 [Ustilaginoidea virens]|uniref:Uncharacterized protein n=1 Tax=Ustilaginoidea virens TaxID=1159556 RepID=A0A8E5HMS7_USTVR|nr:uncharacterized protein UV8b_02090 [Ustilaginoidea virens]QUC17849.1 hypothetical protein UV8b_02090 [Ustilaginoidea virens]